MRKTKLICTIGPSCQDEEMLRNMSEAGMNVARLNLSHGTHEEHKKVIETIRKINENSEFQIGILADIQGPKIRVSGLKDKIELKKGDKISINSPDGLKVDYPIEKYVKDGDLILVDDGSLKLKVVGNGEGIVCEVLNSGTIKSNKSVNVPGVDLKIPFLTEKDEKDIKFAVENEVDFLALSFVRDKNDINLIKEKFGTIPIIAKIESVQSISNLKSIVEAAEVIMIARGDLGVEMPMEKLPAIQYDIIKECNASATPVITATHMLKSMLESPTPTRAEIIDVSNSIFTGTDAVMLSEETAVGNYPLETVKTIDKISREVETRLKSKMSNEETGDIGEMVANAVCMVAKNIKASAIITVTETGNTAKILSSRRIQTPVYTFTQDPKISKLHLLSWGVYSYLLTGKGDSIKESIEILKKNKKIKEKDFVVISAGILDGQRRTYAEVLRI